MSAPIDACPACGAAGLLAICRTVVEYAIANDGDGDQDWSRGEVDDDSSVPTAFRCGSCGVEFRDFTLDDRGYLISLGPGDPGGHVTAPAAEMDARCLRDWLAGRVARWCRENGLPSDGDGCDLGDLYRELDSCNALAALGVTPIPAYDEGVLYIVGPGAAWIAATGIGLGTDGQTVWHDPLANLRLDVPPDRMRGLRDRLRRTADEITGILGGGG